MREHWHIGGLCLSPWPSRFAKRDAVQSQKQSRDANEYADATHERHRRRPPNRGADHQNLAHKNPERRQACNGDNAEYQRPAQDRMFSVRPPISAIRCVPLTCAIWPTAKNIADLVSECMVMCNRPAKFASGPPMPTAKVMMPICSIDE